MSLLLDNNYEGDEGLNKEVRERLRSESFKEAEKTAYGSFDGLYANAMSIYKKKVELEHLNIDLGLRRKL